MLFTPLYWNSCNYWVRKRSGIPWFSFLTKETTTTKQRIQILDMHIFFNLLKIWFVKLKRLLFLSDFERKKYISFVSLGNFNVWLDLFVIFWLICFCLPGEFQCMTWSLCNILAYMLFWSLRKLTAYSWETSCLFSFFFQVLITCKLIWEKGEFVQKINECSIEPQDIAS